MKQVRWREGHTHSRRCKSDQRPPQFPDTARYKNPRGSRSYYELYPVYYLSPIIDGSLWSGCDVRRHDDGETSLHRVTPDEGSCHYCSSTRYQTYLGRCSVSCVCDPDFFRRRDLILVGPASGSSLGYGKTPPLPT